MYARNEICPDKALTDVCLCVCVCTEHEFTVQISLDSRLYSKNHNNIALKKTTTCISVCSFHHCTLMFTDSFCCFWDSEGSPVVSCDTSAITTPQDSEFQLWLWSFCVWRFYYPLLDCESEGWDGAVRGGGVGMCRQERVATQHCK